MSDGTHTRRCSLPDAIAAGYTRFSDRILNALAGRTLTPLLVSLLFILLVRATLEPGYLMNDNIGILRNIENGLETSFMSVALGKALSFLHVHVSPHVPWYGLILYLVHTASIFLFLVGIVRLQGIRALIVPFAVIYLTVYVSFVSRIGYNAASFMIGAHALFACVADSRSGRTRAIPILFLAVALSLSYLLRTSIPKALLLFAAPMLVLPLFSEHRRTLLRAYAVLAVILIAAFALEGSSRRYGVSDVYREFRTFNRVRGRFHDHAVSVANTNNVQLMAMNGWSTNDYRALSNWFFVDEDTYTVRTLGNITAFGNKGRPEGGHAYAQRVHSLHARYPLYFHALALLAAVAVARVGWRRGAVVIACGVYAVAGMVAMDIVYRLPTQIAVPLFLLAYLVLLLALAHVAPGYRGQTATRRAAVLTAVLVVIGGILMVAFVRSEVIAQARRAQQRRVFEDSVAQLKAFPPGSFFVGEPAAAIRWDCMDPLRTRASYGVHTIPLGWSTFSPLFYGSLARVGIGAGKELLPAMIDRPNAFLVVHNERFVTVVLRFAEEHYGTPCRAAPVSELPEGKRVYRLVSDP